MGVSKKIHNFMTVSKANNSRWINGAKNQCKSCKKEGNKE